MGADLYIDSIVNKAKAEHQPKFDDAVAKRDAKLTELAGTPRTPETKAEVDALQKVVNEHYHAMYPDNGYFRDSYNHSSLFWQIDFSWWEITGEKGKPDWFEDIEDEGLYLKTDHLRDFRQMVEQAWTSNWKGRPKFADDENWRKEAQRSIDHAKEHGQTTCSDCGQEFPKSLDELIENWAKYFTEKYAHLLKFIDKAIELNEHIRFSV